MCISTLKTQTVTVTTCTNLQLVQPCWGLPEKSHTVTSIALTFPRISTALYWQSDISNTTAVSFILTMDYC